MAKYIKQEMSDFNGSGTKRCYYRMKSRGCADMNDLIDTMLANNSSVGRGSILHVMHSLSQELIYLLAKGYSVRVDGIGLFTLSLGVSPEKDMDTLDGDETKRNKQSLYVRGVNLRPDARMLKEINRCCRLERGGVRRLHRSPYSREQRLELALEYLDNGHTIMNVTDYERLTGISHTNGGLELNEFCEMKGSGIKSEGNGRWKVYVRDK